MGSDSSLDHARRMSCIPRDLSEMFELARSPDSDLIGLNERAHLAGQIDSQKADLAFFWLEANKD